MKVKEVARLGKPSYLWRAGQDRRLEMVRKFVPLKGKKILDVGCGIGLYLKAFQRFSNKLYGVEIDEKRAREASKIVPNITIAPAEKLPFEDEMFDIVFSNEVLEHVNDDRKAIEEAVRVLKPGGHIVIFAPNRLFPFETHGFYLPSLAGQKGRYIRAGRESAFEHQRGRYIFGNIPLINYLPNFLRDRLAPHVRAYTERDLRKLFAGLPVRLQQITQVYPGFDKIFARIPFLGRSLRWLFYRLEGTPLRIFGLSHFAILTKQGS
jgi:SAM-dependent methyltransferase